MRSHLLTALLVASTAFFAAPATATPESCAVLSQIAGQIETLARGGRPELLPVGQDPMARTPRTADPSRLHRPGAMEGEIDVPHFVDRLAERFGIPWETAYAVAAGFFPPGRLSTWVLNDGGVGVRRRDTPGGPVRHEIDFSDGVLAAYAIWQRRLQRGLELNGDHVLALGRDALRRVTVRGSDGNWQDIPREIGLRPPGRTVTIDGEIPLEVMASLRRYGIAFERLEGTPVRHRLRYPDYTAADRHSADPAVRLRHPLGALDQVMREVADLRRSGAPPELVAAYAMQQVLIVHGLSNHNGRTGRLLAQLIYREMTGRDVLLPAEFHREMNHSLRELVDAIAVNGRTVSRDPRHELYMTLFRDFNVLPSPPSGDVPAAGGLRGEVSFPSFSFEGRTPSVFGIAPREQFRFDRYRELPPEVRLRHAGAAGALAFFGRPWRVRAPDGGQPTARQFEALEADLLAFFSHGRQPGKAQLANDDITEHQSTDGRSTYNSRFFQSTLDLAVARRFAIDPPGNEDHGWGVIYILDPRARAGGGPNVLDINAFANWVGTGTAIPGVARATNHSPNEQEVLWPAIQPADIVGAMIVRRGMSGAEPVRLITNPHYVARSGGGP